MEELKKFEELFQLVEKYRDMDETSSELYEPMKTYAYKYADMRYRFSEMEREEKIERDSHRTSLHNCFMDSVRIYLRYLKNSGIETPDIKWLEDDRKIFGSFACYFIFRVECEQA